MGGWSPKLPPKAIEGFDVHRVEALADTEEEDTNHDEGDQDGECDADLDDEGHALGAGRGKYKTVLQRHEADHLADGVASHHHHQEPEENDGQREGEILA